MKFIFKFSFVIFTKIVLIVSGCSKSSEPSLPACTVNDVFNTPVVPLASVNYAAPIGIMAPVGGSPLPKAHTGFLLNGSAITVTAPGDLHIKSIRKTTYLVSPTRPGYVDYSLFFNVCKEVSGHFGHISSLETDILAKINNLQCSQYSTVDETIESCEQNVKFKISEGTIIGTSGTPPHSPALDVGMRDSRLSDYVNPARYGNQKTGALCPWDWYTEPTKSSIYNIIGDGANVTTETPACGTLNIDLAGTAKGRWTLQSAPANGSDPVAGDFFVLAPNVYSPESEVVISTRIAALNTSSLPEYTIQPSGRLNINPMNITSDGLIYCYDTNLANSTFSYILQMTSATVLRVELKSHSAGSSICNMPANSWSFTSSAMNLIR
jgi:hypothetical protein